MTSLLIGFSDELEKIALIGGAVKGVGKGVGKLLGWISKKPFKRGLLPGWVIASGVEGMRAAKGPGRRILASSRGPSQAWTINYSNLLGRKNLSKLERERLSRHFARYRESK